MSTVLSYGPIDHNRPMTFEEFMSGDYQEGHRYEIIEGRLCVTPAPNYPHDWIEQHVTEALLKYSHRHPEVINRVTWGARVFVPGTERTTAPEPDIAAYHNFPLEAGPNVNWSDVSPLLVVEVMGSDDSEKDLSRNVDLYLRVPSIEEYWVFDIRDDPGSPTLHLHRRDGETWHVNLFESDAVFSTRLLPDFKLSVTPG